MKMFFIVFLVIFVMANLAICYRIYSLLPSSALSKIILILFAILTSTGFIVASIFGDFMPASITSFLAKVGSSWLLIVIYFIILFGIQEIVLLIGKTGILPESILQFFSRGNKILTACIAGFVFVIFTAGYINYQNKKRTYFTLAVNKNNMTAGGDYVPTSKKLRIVNLSDLHLGYTIQEDELAEWVELINKENPDIVLIAGDIIDSSVKAVDREPIIAEFKKIKSTYGVYACPGNHEYISTRGEGLNRAKSFLDKAGINLLRDEVVEIDDAFYIVGRDDKTNLRRKKLKELTDSLDKQKTIIVLDHQPYELELAEEANIDLQLSGHTHKGQIWPISLITEAMYEKDYGLLKKGNSTFYVSSGMGIWGGKFRIGSSSEYVVIDVVHN